MKKTRRQGTEKLSSFWKNLTSGIQDIFNRDKKDEVRDMGEPHTPISRLDLTGMNRQQAKELIGRIIDERLAEISQIELNELKIDYKERERLRAEAAVRINERRKRRKHRQTHTVETIVTEQGVYSDFKQASVFDVIQPEPFPVEEEPAVPVEGQISIVEAIAMEKTAEQAMEAAAVASSLEEEDPYQSSGFDFFGLLKYDPDKEGMTPEEARMMSLSNISTSVDEAVDKLFAFFAAGKARLLQLCRKVSGKTGSVLREKVFPAASAGIAKVNAKLAPLVMKAESKLQLKNKTAVMMTALAGREKTVSEKMARCVDWIDKRNETLIRLLVVIRDTTSRCAGKIRDYAERNKKKVLVGFGAAVAAAAAVTIVIGNMTAYEYIYNGKVLGVVKNQEDVYKTVDIIGDKLSAQYDANITIDKDKDIRFNKVIAFNQDLDDKEDILNRLTYMRDMKANGRGIFVDGKLMGILESDKTAKKILDEIKDQFVKNDANIQYKKVDFAENVEIKDVETKLGNIQAKEQVLEYMLTGAVEKKIHLVQSGETFSEIAKMYGLKQSELRESNPEVIPEKLSIGQEICLNQIVPLVTVQTTEIAQYKEAIPFEIKYENTASLYKNEQTVKSRGTNGEKDVVAEIVRNNGVEVSRKELSVTVLSQPTAQVVLVGTKEPPPLIGTGTFIYPIRGTLTSRFGTRWGRLHSGIDLAAPIGTHIKAADGGKVTFAGYKGALGYMVAIDHGGGRTTWYGHCSKLFVKKGDRVYQGQHIANVGNTGRSTGPHVHFEVHINGKPKNPLKYL